jgi:MYXO-CTERM domain-containing protein
MRRNALAVVAAWIAACVLAPACAGAATIGYWRMEADLDPSADGLEVANEVSGGTSMLSSEAFVDTLANPNGTVPYTGSLNLGSVGGTQQGGGNGINATAAWYAALDTSSVTIEYWARTVENTATLFLRSSGGADGIVIDSPNALAITYYVSDGAGGSSAVSLSGLDNMSDVWRHYAFTYDDASGLGEFFVDGSLVASNDGPDNRPLFWGTQTDVTVGFQMDYAAAFNGTLDEVRIEDRALSIGQFLSTPEPSSAALGLLGLTGLAVLGRRRS